MNESGKSVLKCMSRYDISPNSLIIIHDDMDLEVGRVQVKNGGGLAGHNGLRSIEACIKSRDFVRIRVGIGRPNQNGVDYVLSKLPQVEQDLIASSVEISAQAVIDFVNTGVEKTMNKDNSRSA